MKVTGLAIYPLKSASQTVVKSSTVRERGFEYDRRWMLVDADGLFVSQRKLPRLAALGVAVDEDALELSLGDESCRVEQPKSESMRVEVWGDELDALDAGEAASAWLSERFGTRLNLVWMGDESRREVDSTQVSFADGYPYLLTTEASLIAVQQAVQEPVGMERFRPNIVLDGREPFEEHDWAKIRIGEVVFDVAKPCARCVVTTVDQYRGVKTGKEPLASLARINKIDGAACFGENLMARTFGNTLSVGDEVEVLERR